jgi:hypothetical protein
VDLGVACADGCRSRASYWQRRKDIWSRCIAGKEISLESSLVKLRESRIYWRIIVMGTPTATALARITERAKRSRSAWASLMNVILPVRSAIAIRTVSTSLRLIK